mgnify:FL=1
MPPSKRSLFYKPSAAVAETTSDAKLRLYINAKHGLNLRDYWELHDFSTTRLNDFWCCIWEVRAHDSDWPIRTGKYPAACADILPCQVYWSDWREGGTCV